MESHKTESSRSAWRQRAMPLAIVILVAGLAVVLRGFVTTHASEPELSVAYATWVLALFTLLLAIGIPVTIWLSTNEQAESDKRFLEQEQDQFYAQLDRTYLEIQKLIIDHPHLGGDPAVLLQNPQAAPEHLTQYDAFALIVWNFIESIHEFTRKGDKPLREHGMPDRLSQSWQCIFEYEGARHAQWFVHPRNQLKFQPAFRDYVATKLESWKQTPPSAPTI